MKKNTSIYGEIITSIALGLPVIGIGLFIFAIELGFSVRAFLWAAGF